MANGTVATALCRAGDISSSFANDPAFEAILRAFLQNLPAKVVAIKDALDEQNLAALGKVIHQIKGAGGGYGYQCLTDAAAIAEASIRQNEPLESVRFQVESLLEILSRVIGHRTTADRPKTSA